LIILFCVLIIVHPRVPRWRFPTTVIADAVHSDLCGAIRSLALSLFPNCSYVSVPMKSCIAELQNVASLAQKFSNWEFTNNKNVQHIRYVVFTRSQILTLVICN